MDVNALDSMPEAVGMLQNLEFLNVSDNNLRTLPASLINHESIGRLGVGRNRLCTVTPALSDWLDAVASENWRDSQNCE